MSSKPPPKPSAGKPKVSATRQIPKSQVRRRPPKPSAIMVAVIAVGFAASLAGAVAPLLFAASKWWFAGSFVMLGLSTMAYLALRPPS